MALVGIGAVVAGGLVAAVTSPLQLAHGSWLAAYLVLVVGVGQCAMAAVRLVAPGDHQRGWYQAVSWNAGNTLVVLGTLVGSPWVVDGGGLLCVVALAVALVHARRLARARWVWPYRAVLLILLVSIPIGLVLSHGRHA